MLRDCAITVALKRAQVTMFQQAEKLGLTHKIIHYDTNISLSSIGEYARGETAISGPSLIKLIGVIPDDLLSLLLPDGKLIVSQSEQTNHDEFGQKAIDLVQQIAAAHRPESECAEKIGPTENKVLNAKRTALRAVA